MLEKNPARRYAPYDGKEENQRGLLVIGGSGELGWALVQAAAHAAHTPTSSGVRAVWATFYSNRKTEDPVTHASGNTGVRWFYLNTADSEAVSALIQRACVELGPKVTVVFCAVPKHGGAAGQGGEDVRSGIVDHVLDAARASSQCTVAEDNAHPSCRFVAISTDQVFDGVPPHEPYPVDAPRRALNPYGRYKVEMEDKLCSLQHPDLIVARTSLILTLGQRPSQDGKAIAFLRNALSSENAQPLVLFVDEIRNMSWSEDLARALIEIATAVQCEASDEHHLLPTFIHLACAETANRFELAKKLLAKQWIEYRPLAAKRFVAGLSASSGLNRPLDLTMDVSSMTDSGLVTRTHLRSIHEYLS
jgi:dTDP-4-dehydrorhamnose reductase